MAVTGMHLPARMTIGTPAQRQESMNTRVAKNVSVVEPVLAPGSVPVTPYAPGTWGPKEADAVLPNGDLWHDPIAEERR